MPHPIRALVHHGRHLARLMAGRGAGILRRKIYCITESRDWVIHSLWGDTLDKIHTAHPDTPTAWQNESRYLYNQIIHYGSIWKFTREIAHTHPSNRIVVTFYHGYEGMAPAMCEAIACLRENIPRLSGFVTACEMMANRLRDWGVPEDKLHIIPIGTDCQIFQPPLPEERRAKRAKLHIPDDAICIGSFQKDGDGWDDGMVPKHIKGPDIFVASMKQLRRDFPVFALLTGPARGYVKKGLDDAGVPYRHVLLDDFADIPSMYHALDLYLICSREEGGPKALTEGMATGVPLVSTRVGMAPDMMRHGENGFLVEVEDINAIVAAAMDIITHDDIRQRFIENGLHTAQKYDITLLAERCYQEIYQKWL